MSAKFRCRGSYLSYVVTFFSYYVCLAVFTAVLPVYLTGVGKTKTEMSFIVSASSLFGIAATPLAGYLNDRLKKPKAIACGCLILAACFAAVFSFSRATVALYLLNGCIMGLASAASPITERIASGGRYRYGTVRVWGTVGYAVAAQVCGMLLQYTDPKLIFALFVFFAVLAAAGFLMTGGIRYEAAPQAQRSANRFTFLREPAFLLFAACSFLFAGGSNISLVYCPLYLQELGVETGAVGAVIAVSTLVELPIIFWSNRFMDRFSGKTLLIADFGVMLLQFALYGLLYNAAAAIVVLLLLKATGTTFFMMIRLKSVRNIVGEDCVSTAMGVESAVNAIGSVVFLNLAGPVSEAFGLHALFFAAAGLMALGAALGAFLKMTNAKKVFS